MAEGFSIGSVRMRNKLVLAPMWGVSDLPFRLLCREQGAGLCFTEMINAEAVARNNKYAFRIAETCREDRPLGLQLFGAKPESMGEAALALSKAAEFDFFDLNLGCPQPNIVRQGAGSALLKRPERVRGLVTALKEAGKPVSAKIRLNPNVLNSISFCKMLESAGADCITVHAKTIKQGFGGKADFVALKRIARSVGVPVIANGNIKTRHDVETTLEETKAAAVMIGMGAIGNPGVFASVRGEKGMPVRDAMFSYLELCDKFGGLKFGHQKTQALRFLAAAKEKRLSQEAQRAKAKPELLQILEKLREKNQ